MKKDEFSLTPARAYREGFRWAPVITILGCLAVAVTAVIFLVGWQVGGWFQKAGIARNYSNTVQSQPYQQSLLSEMQHHLENVTGPGGLAATRTGLAANSPEQQVIRAQELDEISQLCAESVNFVPGIAPGSQQFATVITANCLAGTPVSAPPLANPVP